MIIDVHTHILSGDDADRRAVFLRECRRNGVALALVSSVGHFEQFPEPDAVREYNTDIASFDRGAGDLTRWLAYINPQNENWADELERCVSDGAIGIKLWISLKNSSGSLNATRDVIAAAAEKGLPALIHTFNRTDPNMPGEITLEEFAQLAEEAPAAKLIGAHAGANWRNSIGVLRDRAPNACVDISGCFPEKGLVETLVGDIGAERVIFGSDLLGRSLPSQLAKVVFAGVDDEAKELILWKNAARTFALDPNPEAARDVAELRPESDLPNRAIDYFCFCGTWPFFESACRTPSELDAVLRAERMETAYVADLGSLFRLDLEAANRAFLDACRTTRCVRPLAVVNPRAQNWLRVLASAGGGFDGVFVSPYLHNWRLDDSAHSDLFDACSRRGIPVWVNCALGDYRFRHSGTAFRPVAAEELAGFIQAAPSNMHVFQGLRWWDLEPVADALRGDARFRFEISRLTDNTGALDKAISAGLQSQLVMGSEFPLRDIREVWWTAQRQ